MAAFVEHVYSEPSILPVVVVPEVGQFNQSNSLKCGMTIDELCNRPTLKILNQDGSIVEEEDISKKDTTKNYIILRNKKTNKVSIYGSKVTYLKIPDYLKEKTFDEEKMIDRDLEFNLVFRTQKSARLHKSRTNDAINISTDIFNNISSSSETLQSTFSQSTTDEFLIYLPQRCDRFSNNVEKVYPVSTLLHSNEIDLMNDYALEVINALPLSPEKYEGLSKFYISNINRLSTKSVQNICLITLADGLIELLRFKSSDFNSNKYNDIYPSSDVINDKLLDNFLEYSITGRDLTSKMKDKAVCHVIIILFLTNSFVLDLSWISPFLSLNCQKRLITLMRVVGGTPSKDNKSKFFLKMPLATLPSLNNRGLKRAR